MNTDGKQYKALVQERADLINEGRAIFERAEKDMRELTAEETTRDDEINARLEEVKPLLARHEARRERERTMSGVAIPDGARIGGVHERAEDDAKRGFADLAEFALAVRASGLPGGYVDQRLRIGAAPTNYHQENGTGEGRMVPPQFRQEILEAVVESDDSLLNAVETEPTAGNSVEFLRDETTPWGSTGVQAKWRAEASQMTASKLVTEGDTMRLHDLYAFVTATDQLLADAPRLNARLTRKSALALRYKINEAIVNGTGAGQPLGWFTHTAKVSVAKEAAQAADTVVAANIAKMYARLINPGQGNWYVNQDVLPQLFTMTLGDKPIWFPPTASIQNAPAGGFLFGRPVVTLENCATVGDQGDIQFVNPKGYYAITSEGGVQFATSIHLYFDYGLQAFRWTFRMNGQPFLSAAISPAKGASTRAHVVVLDARA